MESKIFTTQEMRSKASEIVDQLSSSSVTAAMLRYAAEVAEENAKLKARLEAVVKVAKEQFDYIFHSPMCWDEDENETHSLEQLREMDALEKIVAIVRGDAGKE